LSWLEANAEALPLADASVDSYTIAFGLRNVTRPEAALAEAARVLRRGGRLLVLEFSHVEFEPLRAAYDAYSFAAIPAMGRLVTGDAAPYQYLVESIRQFATQDELADMMRVRLQRSQHQARRGAALKRVRAQDAGLSSVSYENILGGVVALHSGFKM
jgi:ubiquinone/menaquinone biosynthesis methyltransferase